MHTFVKIGNIIIVHLLKFSLKIHRVPHLHSTFIFIRFIRNSSFTCTPITITNNHWSTTFYSIEFSFYTLKGSYKCLTNYHIDLLNQLAKLFCCNWHVILICQLHCVATYFNLLQYVSLLCQFVSMSCCFVIVIIILIRMFLMSNKSFS